MLNQADLSEAEQKSSKLTFSGEREEIDMAGFYNEYDDEYPCDNCQSKDTCDIWEARFCCTLCEYQNGGDCENCDSMDI